MLAAGLTASACYSAGSGSAPPNNNLYYPVGLAVSQVATRPGEPPGDVLYVANSDFDLQYNGGTLQSYNLTNLRQDTAALIFQFLNPSAAPSALTKTAAEIPFIFGTPAVTSCLDALNASPIAWPNGQRPPLGELCAPPVDSTQPRYFQNSAVTGAFATDLQLSLDGKRLFLPVRGDATVTWANLTGATFDCGQAQNDGRCGGQFLTGNVVDPLDTRAITMPGEPFAMAQTQDGTAIAVTQQATQETSLLLSGIPGDTNPSMQFVLEGVPTGGDGIVAVPHDPDAVTRCEDVDDVYPCTRQAFLETSNAAGEIDLLRYYEDPKASLQRPYLEREVVYPITLNVPGTDQRGIAIDDTPRLKCKAQLAIAAQSTGKPVAAADLQACGQLPARVFIGSRSPASIIYGTLGGTFPDGTYNPDQLKMLWSVPVDPDTGVSRVYLAPIVDAAGHYALRLFVVCYDASTVLVFDPDDIVRDQQGAVAEASLATGPGPFAMAFDPFCTGLVDSTGNPSPTVLDCAHNGPFAEVAVSEATEIAGDLNDFLVPPDPKTPGFDLRTYRFGYLATFTNSYIQVLDLDGSLLPLPSPTPPASAAPRSPETFESIVFTFGNPTPPKGS